MVSAALAVLEFEGQRSELSAIYDTYRRRFVGVALKVLRNREDAEDAVQEAFLRIADRPDTFFSLNDKNRLRYLCAVVRNVAVDMLNKGKRLGSVELNENITLHDDPLESLVLNDISHKELIGFIGSLPPLQQNVLVLTRLLKLSISETAKTLRISETAVNQRLYLARKAIKQFVEERRRDNG